MIKIYYAPISINWKINLLYLNVLILLINSKLIQKKIIIFPMIKVLKKQY